MDDGELPPYPFPDPPEGSRLPPEELISRMATINQYEHDERPLATTMTARTFGMFREPLFTYVHLPCSLHFSDDATVPTQHAMQAMRALHQNPRLMGSTYGTKQGMYGASGGSFHVLYLGYPPADGAGKGTARTFPGIEDILTILRLAPSYQPSRMKWMTTVDPMHQHMFAKRRDDEDVDEPSTLANICEH